MRVRTDADLCIASGNCALTVPDVFDQDEDGVVELLDENPPAALHAAVRTAADRCPAGVISVEE